MTRGSRTRPAVARPGEPHGHAQHGQRPVQGPAPVQGVRRRPPGAERAVAPGRWRWSPWQELLSPGCKRPGWRGGGGGGEHGRRAPRGAAPTGGPPGRARTRSPDSEMVCDPLSLGRRCGARTGSVPGVPGLWRNCALERGAIWGPSPGHPDRVAQGPSTAPAWRAPDASLSSIGAGASPPVGEGQAWAGGRLPARAGDRRAKPGRTPLRPARGAGPGPGVAWRLHG